MKQLLTALALILVMACGANAGQGVNVTIANTISAADTVEGATQVDTAWTPSMVLEGGGVMQFHIAVNQDIGGQRGGGGAQTSDTILVWLQHSFDGQHWTSVVLDTLFGTKVDTFSVSTIIPDFTTVVYGRYLRGMFIYRDSVGADIQDSLGNVQYYDCGLYAQTRD